MRAEGYVPVTWSITGYDWRAHTTAKRITRRCLHAGEGDIILLHDGSNTEPTADRHKSVETDRGDPRALRAAGLRVRDGPGARRRGPLMDELEIGRTLLLFLWAFGLAGIEIEIEGGVGWAERLPTWYLKRGLTGRIYGIVMGQRPLTGYHVYAFTIPMLILHLPYVMGVDWTVAGELRTIATYFVLAVVWDYLWFVLNPAYTVKRFRRGNVWWFEVPWIWRFPLDYYLGVGFSVVLVGLACLVDGSWELLRRHALVPRRAGDPRRRRRRCSRRCITAGTATCAGRAPTTARARRPTRRRRPTRCGRAARRTCIRWIAICSVAPWRSPSRSWPLSCSPSARSSSRRPGWTSRPTPTRRAAPPGCCCRWRAGRCGSRGSPPTRSGSSRRRSP